MAIVYCLLTPLTSPKDRKCTLIDIDCLADIIYKANDPASPHLAKASSKLNTFKLVWSTKGLYEPMKHLFVELPAGLISNVQERGSDYRCRQHFFSKKGSRV